MAKSLRTYAKMARHNQSVLSTCWQIQMLADSINLRKRKRSLHKTECVSLAITTNLAITISLVMSNLVMSSKEAQDLISRDSNQDNLSKVSLSSRISHSKVNLSRDSSKDSHVNKEDLMANTTVQETTTAKKDQRATRAAKVELTT